MARFVSLLLTRAVTILVAGMLMFAVFGGRAYAQSSNQDDNYGLKRFSGDPASSNSSAASRQMPVMPALAAQRLRVAPPPPNSYAGSERSVAAGYDYVLGQGDKLRLTVFGESDLSGEFTVDGAGFVRL